MTTKTKSIGQLQHEIEKLVREHLEAQRRVATAAVDRAFAATVTRTSAPDRSRRRTPGDRRASNEVSHLAERLAEAVRANPGETMSIIAAKLGETPRALNRPMMHLKRAGRVRSAGQRHQTRYFPMTSR